MNRYLCLLFITLLFSACHKNVEEVSEIQFPEEPKVLVSTTQTGKVTDENGKILSGLRFQLGQQTLDLAQQDFYVLQADQLKKYGQQLRVVDQSGATADFALSAVENDINYAIHTFFKQRQTTTFEASETPYWNFTNQLTLKAVPNSLRRNGLEFTGKVGSEAYEVDMAKEIHRRAIPSIRRGRAISGAYNYLKVQRAFHLQLQDADRNQIAGDFTLTEPTSSFGTGETKLWFFNFEHGHWVEVAQNPVGLHQTRFTVAENGWYCLASATPGVFASGKLISGSSVVAHVQLNLLTGEQEQSVYTSAAGKWTAFLPSNTKISASVVAPCGVLHTFHFETSSVEVKNLETDLTNIRAQFAQVKGIVKDCDGKPSKAYVLRLAGKEGSTYYRNGAIIDLLIPICGESEINLSTANADGSEVGNVVAWPSSAVVETGTWFACSQAQKPYFNLIIDGENKMYWSANATKNVNNRLEIRMTDSGKTQADLTLFTPGDGVGDKPDPLLNILLQSDTFNGKAFEIYCPTSADGCGFERFTFTHFDYKGDKFIRGYFKGKFWTKSYGPLKASYKQIEGEFQVAKAF